MYKHEVYHDVSLQYFYNALLKSATLTKSDVYILSIYSTQDAFSCIEQASVQGSSKECDVSNTLPNILKLEYWYIAITS